ncbi:hypothetical protein OK176_002589 [Salmonella enterica]|nr:hypothetical protein [Salmonella enterica]
MAKIGENVPLLIDKAVDFMASSQAFREYLNKTPPRDYVPSEVPSESAPIYLQRLEYYRRLYQPKEEERG